MLEQSPSDFHDTLTTRFAGRGVAGSIAQGEEADAFKIPFQANFAKPSLPLGLVKHFAGTIDPAAGKPKGVGAEHHVAQDERAVIDMIRVFAFADNEEIDGRTIERVCHVSLEEGGVGLANACLSSGVADDDDAPRLFALAGSGVGACLNDLVNEAFFGKLRQLAATTAARQNGVHDGFCTGGEGVLFE